MTEPTPNPDRFADCKTLESLIFQAIGAGSTCWEHLDRAGIFQSTEARQIGVDAFARLIEIEKADPPVGYVTNARLHEELAVRAELGHTAEDYRTAD